MVRLRKIEKHDYRLFNLTKVNRLTQVDCLALNFAALALINNADKFIYNVENDVAVILNEFIFQQEALYPLEDTIIGYDRDSDTILPICRLFITENDQLILEIYDLANVLIEHGVMKNTAEYNNRMILDNTDILADLVEDCNDSIYYIITL